MLSPKMVVSPLRPHLDGHRVDNTIDLKAALLEHHDGRVIDAGA